MTTVVRYNRVPSFFNRAVARQFNNYYSAPAVPAVNVKEAENAYQIEVAVPGLKKEDFAINLHNNLLTISAKQETKSEETTDTFTRKEFGYSNFERSFRLPKNINSEQIQAAYTDGVLKIELPKVEKPVAEPKQIAVA